MNATKTPPATCTTCGSEIVESVNGSNFGDGECGPCEYARYRSQPAIREAADVLWTAIADTTNGCVEDPFEKHADELRAATAVLRKADEQFPQQHGKAA